MQEEKFKVQMVDPSTLKPAEYNPRRLTSKQEETLTKSIKKYKLLDPIVVNKFKGRENIIISGHQRMKVAQKHPKVKQSYQQFTYFKGLDYPCGLRH